MLTPFFTISQDEEFIYIEVHVSHVRFNAKAIEMTVEGPLFKFSLPPYYLRLRLPFACVDDERSHSKYEDDKVKIKIPKEVKGQEFPDLDLTAKLLARTNELGTATSVVKDKPLIEEMDVDNAVDTQRKFEEGDKFDWEISQNMPEQMIPTNKYGFNNQYDGIVGVSMSNGNDINELGDPENTPEGQRIMERLIKENIKFDPEYYAADYMMSKTPEEDEKDFMGLMKWKNPVTQLFLKWYKSQLTSDNQQQVMTVEFTAEEQKKMMELPKKSYLVADEYKFEIYLLIISLLFAYHFDLRETEGDHNVESAWTIGRLVAQFSCLDSKININTPDNPLRSMIITCMRRSLCYPLHRNYDLSMKVWDDVYYNLRGGKRLVLKSLLDLKELFRFHDIYYIYDHIWMKDLCSWMLNDMGEMPIRQLAHDLKRELEKVDKTVVTFEKVDTEIQEPDSDDEEDENENDDNDDDMIVLSVQEIETMCDSGI